MRQMIVTGIRGSAIGLLAVGLVSLYIAWRPMAIFNPEYPMWRCQEQFIHTTHNPAFTTLVMGDSAVKAALLPRGLPGRVHSLTLGGGTAVELYYSLRTYTRHNPYPHAVVLSLSPFHLMFPASYFDRTVKFNYLDFSQLMEVYDTMEQAQVDPASLRFPVSRAGYVMKVMEYRLNGFWRFRGELFNHLQEPRLDANRRIAELTQRNHGHNYFGMFPHAPDPTIECDYAHFVPNRLLTIYLVKLLDDLKAHNVRVAVVPAPFNQASQARMHQDFTNEYEQFMQLLAGKYPAFRVTTQQPYYPDHCFGDPRHMNPRGAARFTAEVAETYGDILDDSAGGR